MAARTANELIEDIERRVTSGQLRPGDRLPSIQAQAGALSLAPNTVASAYRRLRERGVVVGRGKQGSIIAERPMVTPVLTQRVPDGVVDAMTGNPDPELLPDLAGAMAAAAAYPAARYGDALVNPTLAEQARARFVADGVDASHLTVTSGATDAISRLLAAHLRPGDRVGLEDPGYSDFQRVVGGMGLEVVPIACDDLGPQPESLAAGIDAGLSAVVVTPRAGNPAGGAFDAARAAEIDDVVSSAEELLIIEDDYADGIAGTDYVCLSHDRPKWAVVRSMAKSLGPDLRVAVVVGDRESVDRIEARIQVGTGWVSHLLQRVVAELLADHAVVTDLDRAAQTYVHRRTRLRDALLMNGLPASGRSGFHVWLPVPDEQPVVIGLRDRGFAIRSGDRYRIQSPPAVRLNAAALSDEQIDDLASAMSDTLTTGVNRSSTA